MGKVIDLDQYRKSKSDIGTLDSYNKDLQERVKRVKESLGRVNKLMREINGGACDWDS